MRRRTGRRGRKLFAYSVFAAPRSPQVFFFVFRFRIRAGGVFWRFLTGVCIGFDDELQSQSGPSRE